MKQTNTNEGTAQLSSAILYITHATKHIFRICAIYFVSKHISVCSNLALNVCYKFVLRFICGRFSVCLFVYVTVHYDCRTLFLVHFHFLFHLPHERKQKKNKWISLANLIYHFKQQNLSCIPLYHFLLSAAGYFFAATNDFKWYYYDDIIK